DGIRDKLVTGVQTCALPISRWEAAGRHRIFRKQSILSSYQESADTWEYCHSQSAQADDTGLTVRFQFGGSIMNSREPVLALIQRSEERRIGKECRCGGVGGL